MDKIHELISIILSNEKFSRSKAAGNGVFHDEPIIKTASQMAAYLPPKYREMRNIAKSDDGSYLSEAQLFYQQGKFMEDFEDNFDYHGGFFKYFPTYRAMNDFQLRGYFSWRTKVRAGNVEPTSLSFVYVYIYELLNQIGVTSDEDGFEKLRSFWSAYRTIDARINHYIKLWLSDYVVYYNLDKSLLEGFDTTACDDALSVLVSCGTHNEDEIFAALTALSSYNPEKSKFFRAYPDDMRGVICTVYKKLSEHYEKKCKNTLFSKLFGSVFSGPYLMFSSAVFYDRKKQENYEYIISDLYKYKASGGQWRCERYYGSKGKNQQLGAILKTVDRIMREKYCFSPPLKPIKTTKTLVGIIDRAVDELLEEKRRNETPEIKIDISKLGDIRRAALKTQDKLIVDEYGEEDTDAPQEEPCEAVSDTLLSDAEFRLMQCLVYGGDSNAVIKENGMMLSVAIDSINEKLFDMFSDTVIDSGSDKPEIIEDYLDELKGIIKQ